MEESIKISITSTKPSSFITESGECPTGIKGKPEDILFSASLNKISIQPDLNKSNFFGLSCEKPTEDLDNLFLETAEIKEIEPIKDKGELQYLDLLSLDIKKHHATGAFLTEEQAACLRKAPITVNFKLKNLLKYNEPRLKSPSRLSSDRGSDYMKTRIEIENKVFSIPTEHYNPKDPKSTPKYAAINIFNKTFGAASGYGMNCFIFNDEIKNRCTVTTTDSFKIESNAVRDFDTINTLPLLPEQIKALNLFIKSKCKNSNLDMNPYIEVQIHGNVDLQKSCKKIIINQDAFNDLSEDEQKNINEKLQNWAIPVEFK